MGAWTYEGLHRESKNVFASNAFEGAQIEATSVLSRTFTVSHALKWASTQQPSSYHFAVLSQPNKQTTLHGLIDQDGSLSARAHYSWNIAQEAKEGTLPAMRPAEGDKSRVEAQISSNQTLMSIEHEHVTKDYSLALRAINPIPFDRPSVLNSAKSSVTGIYSIAYLQHLFPSLAVGGEFLLQRPAPDFEESAVALAVKYAPEPTGPLPTPEAIPSGMTSPYPNVDPSDPHSIWTATFSPSSGMMQASYWRRLNQRLEVAADLQTYTTLGSARGPGRREGIATLGFRLQTLFAHLRAQVDSHGRVVGMTEYALAPGLQFQVSAEMDYAKGNGGLGKVGLGFTMEA